MTKRHAEAQRASADDLMTTKELADYLRLNERTVLKLAASGELPGVRLGNQWRFRRGALDAWLDDQMLGVRRQPSIGVAGKPPTFELGAGFREEHVIAELSSETKTQCLGELCARAGELSLVRDRTWFLGALLERENVLSSSVGEGVAFPHTLDRHPEQIREPFVLLGRSRSGIEFASPDGRPVHLIVLLGLRYQQLHLPWLSLLSSVLRAGRIRSSLMAARSAKQIHRLLLDATAARLSEHQAR